MEFTTMFITLLATTAMANPVKRNGGNPTPYDACPDGLYSNLQCCATDILGVADLNCASPSEVPTSPDSFESICAEGGKAAACCVVPVTPWDLISNVK
ncbi:hypothetical protein RRF57_006936 [Xylaria bambusicola]|uniref:Hydrophobin n=1 Tax=Xylaria bambusicola TaxID=326684 RepID=A0AAN7Z766_9PEZI